jgi:lipoate-protein ligase A
METWLLMDTGPGAPGWNMALDEALLRTAPQRGRAVLRVYAWTQPAVSIGYFQKYPRHLALTHAVVRRPTGGGLVYHVDDTTYTVVTPPGHWLHKLSTGEAYCALHKAVAAAMSQGELASAETGGVQSVESRAYECFANPVAGDVVAGGRKLAGAAQRRTRDGLLHQGSIAGRVDVLALVVGFARVLGVAFDSVAPTGQVIDLARKLASEKYDVSAWNERVR